MWSSSPSSCCRSSCRDCRERASRSRCAACCQSSRCGWFAGASGAVVQRITTRCGCDARVSQWVSGLVYWLSPSEQLIARVIPPRRKKGKQSASDTRDADSKMENISANAEVVMDACRRQVPSGLQLVQTAWQWSKLPMSEEVMGNRVAVVSALTASAFRWSTRACGARRWTCRGDGVVIVWCWCAVRRTCVPRSRVWHPVRVFRDMGTSQGASR
jgi:hypothetical protein